MLKRVCKNVSKSSGEFGKLAAQYDAMRPSYPKKAISILYRAINTRQPIILDLGCGTGISTRQLAKNKGLIVGCDADVKMLITALQRPEKNVSYMQGVAEKLPFADGTFDAVTAFIAFHWFMNRKSISEIKRVLKPGGILYIAQPRYAAIQKDFRMILERELGHNLPKNYKISTEILPFLGANGFHAKCHTVHAGEKYRLDQYIALLQSYSLWNYVPVSRRKEISRLLRLHFRAKLQKGYIRNIKDVEVIIAALN